MQSAWRPLAARSRRVAEIAVQKVIATRIQTCAALMCRRAGYGFTGPLGRSSSSIGRFSPVQIADNYYEEQQDAEHVPVIVSGSHIDRCVLSSSVDAHAASCGHPSVVP